MNHGLSIQDYLDAAGDSAKRARTISISLVVASVLVFAGLLNSLQHSWMMSRLRLFHDYDKEGYGYVSNKIGRPPISTSVSDTTLYRIRYQEFYGALSRTFVDNS